MIPATVKNLRVGAKVAFNLDPKHPENNKIGIIQDVTAWSTEKHYNFKIIGSTVFEDHQGFLRTVIAYDSDNTINEPLLRYVFLLATSLNPEQKQFLDNLVKKLKPWE